MSCINLNIETSSFFVTGGRCDKEKFDFWEVRFCGKLRVNVHSVAVKDTWCTMGLLVKFELPAGASNKTRLNT